MSITKDVPVPTSYRRLQEKKIFNVHARLLLVWATFFVIYGFLVIGLWKVGISNIMFYLVPGLGLGSILFAIARDVYTLDRSTMHVLLMFRILRNRNITKKYTEPLDDLKKIIPIDSVEETGLIRYVDSTSGVLILMDPPRIAEDDMERHSIKMKNVVNSLYGNFTFQFLTVSMQEPNNPLTTTALDAMKFKDTPKQVTNILNSLYNESLEQTNVINWQFILLVTIPANTINESEKLKMAFISGLSKELRRAGMFSRVIENRNEVIQMLRGCVC